MTGQKKLYTTKISLPRTRLRTTHYFLLSQKRSTPACDMDMACARVRQQSRRRGGWGWPWPPLPLPSPSLAILSLWGPQSAPVCLSTRGGEGGVERGAGHEGPGRANQASLWGREWVSRAVSSGEAIRHATCHEDTRMGGSSPTAGEECRETAARAPPWANQA